jgi:hypothetical protein
MERVVLSTASSVLCSGHRQDPVIPDWRPACPAPSALRFYHCVLLCPLGTVMGSFVSWDKGLETAHGVRC